MGLVVHAAVDGVALGAAATTAHTDVEMIVFLAIMLHKVILESDNNGIDNTKNNFQLSLSQCYFLL